MSGAGGVDRAAWIGGERFLVGGRAHEDLIAVGCVVDDDALGLHPAGDGGRGFVGVEDRGVAGVFFLDVGVGEDAQPVAAFLGDDHLAPDLHAAHLLRAQIGGDIEPADAQGRSAGASHGLLQVVFLLLGGQRQRTEDEA